MKITYTKVYPATGKTRNCAEHCRDSEAERIIAWLTRSTPEQPHRSESEPPFYVAEVRVV